jgi:hypothetical protein
MIMVCLLTGACFIFDVLLCQRGPLDGIGHLIQVLFRYMYDVFMKEINV